MAERLRIAVGQFAQETNHFNPHPTTLADLERFGLRRGEAVLTSFGAARTEVPGFLSVLAARGAEAVPTLAAWASSASGPVRRDAFEAVAGEMVVRLRAAGPVDGALLALHGAMVLEDADDAEAEIVARVRGALPAGTPIGVSLDLHGHITPAMLQPGVFYVGYREYPHIDMHETGVRTAELLLDTLAERRPVPAMALAKRPMVVSPVCARTPDPPLSEVVEAARAAESAGEAHAVSLFPVQPWLDVPGLGFAVLVCADEEGAARRVAERIADMAWERRHRFEPELAPLGEAIRVGLAAREGMTLVGDVGDAPTAGTCADRPDVLRALLEAGAERHDRPVLLTLCDPRAAAEAHRAGVGAGRVFRLGHAMTPGEPVEVEAVVERLGGGRFTMRDGGATGSVVEMGPSTVLRVGDALRVAVRSVPGNEWDTGVYRSVGLEPAEAALVFVKSPGHFRVAFGPLAARTLMADTPGGSCGNMRRVPWTRVTRPLWPLDPL